jgi:hypothetical protein
MALAAPTRADISNCTNVHVGTVWVAKGNSLVGVVFVNAPGESSGSYLVSFSGWSEAEKQSALALLTLAKNSQRPVTLTTEHASGCAINTAGQIVKDLYY